MQHRFGFAAATATLATTLLAAPTHAGDPVDTTPPEVGTCHDLTRAEAWRWAEPKRPVECTDTHTTLTVRVRKFRQQPKWKSNGFGRTQYRVCTKGVVDFFGGRTKALQMSAYIPNAFIPTKRQRDAGASWLRCDLMILAASGMPRLPGDGNPQLGRPPHPDRVAKCFTGARRGYAVTPCAKSHSYRATVAVRYRAKRYPGREAMKTAALRACRRKVSTTAFVYQWIGPGDWAAGLRHHVCAPKTTRSAAPGGRQVGVLANPGVHRDGGRG